MSASHLDPTNTSSIHIAVGELMRLFRPVFSCLGSSLALTLAIRRGELTRGAFWPGRTREPSSWVARTDEQKAMDNSARMRGCSMCSPPNQQAALDWPPTFHRGSLRGRLLFATRNRSSPIATHRMRPPGPVGFWVKANIKCQAKAQTRSKLPLSDISTARYRGDNKRLRAFV